MAFVKVSPTLGYVDIDRSGTDVDGWITLTLDASFAGFVAKKTIQVRDVGFTLVAGTATTISPKLTGVAGGSTRNEELISIDNSRLRPEFSQPVLMRVPDNAIYYDLDANTSHATNQVTGRIWLQAFA